MKAFPKGELPYAITKEALKEKAENAALPYDKRPKTEPVQRLEWKLTELLPLAADARFSRMPTFTEPIKHIQTAENHILVYAKVRGFSDDWKNYCMSVFDLKGNHIHSEPIANAGHKEFITATVDKNLMLTRTVYSVTWEDAFDADEKIVAMTQKSSEVIDMKVAPQINNKKEGKKIGGKIPDRAK